MLYYVYETLIHIETPGKGERRKTAIYAQQIASEGGVYEEDCQRQQGKATL